MRILLILLAFVLSLPSAGAQTQARRVALVIGVQDYPAIGGAQRLTRPRADAELVHAALVRAGFDAGEPVLDPDIGQLNQALRDFRNRTQGAEAAVLYFAGHGVNANNEIWLVPRGATLAREDNMFTEAVRLDDVVRYTMGAASLKIVFLDACRNNPWTARSGPGLPAPADVPEGVAIAYAAAAGQTASDDGVYAQRVAARIGEEGLELRQLFSRVADDVSAARGLRADQRPGSFFGSLDPTPFYFVAPTRPPTPSGALVARSRDFAAEAQRLIRQGKRDEAIAAALSGLPPTYAAAPELSPSRDAYQLAVRSREVRLPLDLSNVWQAWVTEDGERALIAFHPSPELREQDGTLELWDARHGRKIGSMRYSRSVAAVSRDGRTLAGIDLQGQARVLDAYTGAEIASFPVGVDEATDIELEGPRSFLVGRNARSLEVWDTRTHQRRMLLEFPDSGYGSLHPSGERILAISGLTLSEYEVGASVAQWSITAPDAEELIDVGYTHRGNYVVGVAVDDSSRRTFVVWLASTGEEVARIRLEQAGMFAVVDPEERRLAVIGPDQMIVVRQFPDLRPLTERFLPPAFYSVVDVEGEVIPTGPADISIAFWRPLAAETPEALEAERLKLPPQLAGEVEAAWSGYGAEQN